MVVLELYVDAFVVTNKFDYLILIDSVFETSFVKS